MSLSEGAIEMSRIVRLIWRKPAGKHRADELNPANPRYPWFELRQQREMELADRA
jgi:hypothetical protein